VSSKSSVVLAFWLLCALAQCASGGWAQDCEAIYPRHELAEWLSDISLPMCALAAGVHLLSDDATERETGKRMAEAIVLSLGTAGTLKSVISDRRPAPNDTDTDGMPSAHSAICFATAAVIAERRPSAAVPAYCTAGLIGWSRYRARAHHWDQVLIGAALGTYIGHRAARGDWGIWSDKSRGELALTFADIRSGLPAAQRPMLHVRYHIDF
jgi:hypothetical protein